MRTADPLEPEVEAALEAIDLTLAGDPVDPDKGTQLHLIDPCQGRSTTFFSGATLEETELGVTTVSASGGLNLVARMKKDNSRKATSHIAVMSMFVLFRGSFA